MLNSCSRPFAALFLALFALTALVRAEPPKLTKIPGNEPPNVFQAGGKYTIKLQYTDPAGDDISKSDAKFFDQAPTGLITIPASSVDGSTKTGAYITWEINGFEQGSHRAHFEVKGLRANARYPDAAAEDYAFVVESLTTKIITMVAGTLISVIAIPMIAYLLFRALNPRGDPSRAARIGFLIGILAACVLFIYLFLNVYGPLVYAILFIGLIASLVLMLRR